MRLDEFLALHEHATGAAAEVEDAAFVRGKHFDEEPDYAARSIKLAALLTFGAGEPVSAS